MLNSQSKLLKYPSNRIMLAVFLLASSLLALEILFIRFVSILFYPVST